MCGRYSLYTHKTNPEAFNERFSVIWPEKLDFPPSYNIGPYRDVPVVYSEKDGTPAIRMMQWQLIPSFSKEFKSKYAMFNTRVETIRDKPFWQRQLSSARCIIPFNNFFEWAKVGGEKVPHKFYEPERALLAAGGLFSSWEDPAGFTRYSASMITVPANDVVGKIHGRMPFILPQAQEKGWLDSSLRDFQELQGWIKTYPAENTASATVSQDVNNIRNDHAGLIEPLVSAE